MPWAILDVNLQLQHATFTTALYKTDVAYSYLSVMQCSPIHGRMADAGHLHFELQS